MRGSKPRQVFQVARRFRKLPLTTKDINKGFYKGTGTGSMGQHTKFGGYVIDWQKVRTYAVPAGLDAFKVRTTSRLSFLGTGNGMGVARRDEGRGKEGGTRQRKRQYA